MRTPLLIAALATLVLAAPAYAKRQYLKVVVAEPYLELRTGPGRGYPVFQVVDRGETVEVLRQRTDWFQVRTARGVKGWVGQGELSETLQGDGTPLALPEPGWADFTGRRWEVFVGFGDFDGASSVSIAGAWRMSANLSAELLATQVNGEFSDGWLVGARLLHTPFPEWRIAPYLLLGTGVIQVNPRTTLVSSPDRTDQFAQAGIGLRAWLTRRFVFRAEYTGDVVFTSRDDNEEVREWKAGFAFFF